MEEVDGIPRAYIHRACSGKEKPEEKDLSTKSGISDDAASPASSMNGCFDCNICLDFVVDPVVTLCGHLYCWPCIYKWMQVESMSPRQCPVCKASLSQDTLVPLYGRGGQSPVADSEVPHRPTLHRDHAVFTSVVDHRPRGTEDAAYVDRYQPTQQPQFRRHQHDYSGYASLLGTSYTSGGSSSLLFAPLFRSTAGGVLGGLAILPWAQRNHGMNTYYASPYPFASGSNNPRLLRHQMQVESSLHQICLFLFFCALLCLLLF
ncbi:E3 ubiquitin-protein ligase RMA1-like [Musa acuminata AAA Group]|uniref:E3 ubiquitin-protein ligase RMA n=1 Tax=Musa acuminata subsp. malaccensis TaxID=214687 RepID=A0A804HZP2_MUSAM|nr:PREDICTED: E3 ubiquitin-protein ligase RMA1-like [Musa acuminata subsp. malaccensis]CAG1861213.1 unnamed protein product [Musa acuminata subsp. malaccensis]